MPRYANQMHTEGEIPVVLCMLTSHRYQGSLFVLVSKEGKNTAAAVAAAAVSV